MTDSNKLGTRIRAARKAAGFKTAKIFIDKYEIPASTYSQHESGARSPNDESLKLYSELFAVNFEWLKSGDGVPYLQSAKQEKGKSETVSQEMMALELHHQRHDQSSQKNKLDEKLLAFVLEKILEMSKKTALSASKIAKIASEIYSDVIHEDANFDMQSTMVLSAIKVYKRTFTTQKK